MKKLILLAAVVMIAGCAFGQKKPTNTVSVSGTSTVKVESRDEQHRKLFWALRTRILTATEMKQVEDLDYRILIHDDMPYNAAETKAEFNAALLQQFRIRIAAESLKAKEKPSCEGIQMPAQTAKDAQN